MSDVEALPNDVGLRPTMLRYAQMLDTRPILCYTESNNLRRERRNDPLTR